MPVPVLELPALSTEYVMCPLEIRDNAGAVADPTSYPLQLALPAAGVQPATWYAGSWETRQAAHTWLDENGAWHTWQPPIRFARLLVGPAGGAVALTAGALHDLWVDVAPGGAERIRRRSGLVRVV